MKKEKTDLMVQVEVKVKPYVHTQPVCDARSRITRLNTDGCEVVEVEESLKC